jgi:hypothetical protein
MCAIRRSLANAGNAGLDRASLIHATARELGFARTTEALKTMLDASIRRAVRRGVADNSAGVLSLFAKGIDAYAREHLKVQLLMAMRATGGTCAKGDAALLLARALGFARTGPTITATVDSLVRSLIRAQRIESKGGQLRVLRRNESHE